MSKQNGVLLIELASHGAPKVIKNNPMSWRLVEYSETRVIKTHALRPR